MYLLLLAAIFLAAEPAAVPSEQAPSPAAEGDTALKPGERRVKIKCRTEPVNGSRILKRRCMTLEEWERLEEESAKALEDLRGASPLPTTCQGTMRSC